jgi:hypothetical protein
MGTQRVQVKGVFPCLVWFVGLFMPVQEIFPYTARGPVQTNFFLTLHYFNSFITIAQQAALIKKKIEFSSYILMYKEIQNGAVAKSNMTSGLLI